jgi:hypothetical protein
MRFGLARFAIVLTRATVRSPIAPIGIAFAVFAFAPFKVFSVRWTAFVAEFFERASGGSEGIRCGAERVDEATIHPTLPHHHPQRKSTSWKFTAKMRSQFREVWTRTLSRLGQSPSSKIAETTVSVEELPEQLLEMREQRRIRRRHRVGS